MTSEKILDLVARAAPYLAKHGSPSPRLDAELLLAEVLGIDRMDLYLQFERPLTVAEVDSFRALCRRRAGGEPVAYIRGRREFMSLDLLVTPAVMIPRPETEVLVEEGLRRLKARAGEDHRPRALDVGTGSGAIAVALAAHCPEALVVATERSERALEVARRNVERLEVKDRVELVAADLVDGVEGPFDLVAANLPYIDPDWDGAVSPEVLASEPEEALFAGRDGLDVIGRLLPELPRLLAADGVALLEFDPRARKALDALVAGQPSRGTVLPDLAGLDRVLVLEP
ncbi:MAG: peptide chain release factor N(5)-glutamine methyltransferase [Candidatus Dormiibacterota bacterium]